MVAWYVNFGNGTSTGYYAVAQWQAAPHSYSIGDIVRQLATPAVGSERCFRCTTAGLSGVSEPSPWTLTKGGTTTSGAAVFTEVTGNSTYNWNAPSARLALIYTSYAAAGDDIYVASAHAETQATSITLTGVGNSASPLNVYCVNAAGSVPPVAADLTTGATISITGGSTNLVLNGHAYFSGIAFVCASGANTSSMFIGSSASSNLVFQNCAFNHTDTNTSSVTNFGQSGLLVTQVELINSTMSFGSVSQSVVVRSGNFIWRDTPSTLAGSAPTTLITTGTGGGGVNAVLRALDLSTLGSGKTLVGNMLQTVNLSILNCALGASVTVVQATPTTRAGGMTDLVISDSSGTTYRQERHWYEGDLTSETTFVLSAGNGGATDGVTPISWKVVTTSNVKRNFPFKCFPIVAWNTSTSLVTATIEIESNATLQDADIWVEFEYLSASGNPIATLKSTAPATPLTTAANLPTSSVTWNGSLGSAVKQYLQTTFTPGMAGYIRATISITKATQTLYINPVITLT